MIILSISLILIALTLAIGPHYYSKHKKAKRILHKTIEYRVANFIKKHKILPEQDVTQISFDSLKQLFLRHGNEDIRKEYRSELKEEILSKLFDIHLDKNEDGKFLINTHSKFRPAPIAQPIDDDALII